MEGADGSLEAGEVIEEGGEKGGLSEGEDEEGKEAEGDSLEERGTGKFHRWDDRFSGDFRGGERR